MDYRIDFAMEDSDGVADLLRRISATNDQMQDFVLSLNETGITLSGIGDRALYRLLSAYFAEARPGEGGALVTLIGTPSVAMVAITDEADAEIGRTPLGVNVRAGEILASEASFCAAWPTLVGSICEDEAIRPETMTVAGRAIEMIFASLLSRAGPADEMVSFLILGISAKSVMEDLVGAGTYEALDPEFLRHEVGNDGTAIEVVSFGTSEGPGVELRVPVADARAAIAALARHIGPAFAGRVFYVAEIRDAEEVFVVRVIGEAGVLGEARRVRLV